jgi:hypothetical protein
MTEPQRHIQEIRQRRKESHDDVLDSLAGAIDRLEKAFPGQWHFLMEFIQNADDANSTSLSIDISRDEIQILNNGNTFDEDDVESICKVGRSSKQYTEKGEDYIGYLGVGFKSVFLISDNPQIYSDDYRFEFDRNSWERPEETPWQIYPLWIDNPSRDIVKGDYTTGFRIPLSGSVDDEMFDKLIDEVSAEQVSDRTLLFLRNLEEIEIKDRVRGSTKRIVKSKKADNDNYEIYEFKIYEDGEITKTTKWLIFRSTSTIPPEIKEHQLTQRWERDGLNTREVMVGFRLNEDDMLTKEKGTAHMGVFSFLPLKEVPSGLNFLVQADFLTAPGREVIHREAPWNEWLAGEVYELLISDVVPEFKQDERWKYNFTNILYPGDGGHEIFNQEIHQPLQDYLKSESVLIDQNGRFVKAGDAVEIDNDIKQMVSISDLETLFPEKSILHQDCGTPWQISNLVTDGPNFNSNKGLKNGMADLLELKADQGDIDFFRSFYEKIGGYADSTLSGSSLKKSEIVLTQENTLERPNKVFFSTADVDIPSELEGRFNFVHNKLLEESTRQVLERLGVDEITRERVQSALNVEEIPNIQENWDSFSDQEKVEKTRLCKELWEENEVSLGELEFLTIKVKNGGWVSPSDVVFSGNYQPDHRVESLAEDGLLDIDLEFLAVDYVNADEKDDVDSWRKFFEKLGVEDNLSKSNISETVAVETALRFEQENGRDAEALPRHKEKGGYDIRSKSMRGERLIEAKGRKNESPQISLTPNQFERLQNEGENYYIYVVRDALNYPTLSVIKGEKILSVDRSIKVSYNEWQDLGNEEYQPFN